MSTNASTPRVAAFVFSIKTLSSPNFWENVINVSKKWRKVTKCLQLRRSQEWLSWSFRSVHYRQQMEIRKYSFKIKLEGDFNTSMNVKSALDYLALILKVGMSSDWVSKVAAVVFKSIEKKTILWLVSSPLIARARFSAIAQKKM